MSAASSKNQCAGKKRAKQIHQENIFGSIPYCFIKENCIAPIVLCQKLADILLVIYGSLRFEDTFCVLNKLW